MIIKVIICKLNPKTRVGYISWHLEFFEFITEPSVSLIHHLRVIISVKGSTIRSVEYWKWSRSVVSSSLWPHRLQPARLLRPWDSPGKSTGVSCHSLLWGSSRTRDQTQISHITGKVFTMWATREGDSVSYSWQKSSGTFSSFTSCIPIHNINPLDPISKMHLKHTHFSSCPFPQL